MLEYERPACRVLSGLVQARQSSWSIIAIQCYRGMRVDGAEEGRGRSSRASCQVKPDYDINVAKVVGCFRSVHSWQTMVDKAKGVACYRVRARRSLGKARPTALVVIDCSPKEADRAVVYVKPGASVRCRGIWDGVAQWSKSCFLCGTVPPSQVRSGQGHSTSSTRGLERRWWVQGYR